MPSFVGLVVLTRRSPSNLSVPVACAFQAYRETMADNTADFFVKLHRSDEFKYPSKVRNFFHRELRQNTQTAPLIRFVQKGDPLKYCRRGEFLVVSSTLMGAWQSGRKFSASCVSKLRIKSLATRIRPALIAC